MRFGFISFDFHARYRSDSNRSDTRNREINSENFHSADDECSRSFLCRPHFEGRNEEESSLDGHGRERKTPIRDSESCRRERGMRRWDELLVISVVIVLRRIFSGLLGFAVNRFCNSSTFTSENL